MTEFFYLVLSHHDYESSGFEFSLSQENKDSSLT